MIEHYGLFRLLDVHSVLQAVELPSLVILEDLGFSADFRDFLSPLLRMIEHLYSAAQFSLCLLHFKEKPFSILLQFNNLLLHSMATLL